MAAQESRRRQEPTAQVSSDGSGEEYRVEETEREESANESAEWSGADTDKLATEDEAATTGGRGGGGGVSEMRTTTEQGSQGSGAGPLTGATSDSRVNTWVVTSATADKVGVGGRHGAIPGVRERVPGWQENPAEIS